MNNSAEHPSTAQNCVAGRCKLLASSVFSSRSMVILTFATVSKPCPAIVQRAYNHCTFSMVSVSSLVCFDLFVLPLHTTKLLNGENDKRPVDASGHPPDINTDDQTCIANLLTQASKCLKWWGVMAGSSGHVWWGSRIWSSPSTSWTFLQHSLLDTMVAHTHTQLYMYEPSRPDPTPLTRQGCFDLQHLFTQLDAQRP